MPPVLILSSAGSQRRPPPLGKGRWLAHAVDDPDAGYTMSLWESEAAIRSYENSEILQKTILPQLTPFFSGDYTTTRCEVRLAEEF
jgi:heme-degrading monooxygenase HmoA